MVFSTMSAMELELDPGVRRVEPPGRSGSTLLGGSPLRVVVLTADQTGQLDSALGRATLGDSDVSEAGSGDPSFLAWLLNAGFVHPRLGQTAPGERDRTKRIDRLGSIDMVIPIFASTADSPERTSLASTLAGLAIERFASVTVVDDGSVPAIDLASLPSGVDLVRQQSTSGAATARNVGWRRGAAELVVFLDADVDVNASEASSSLVFEQLGSFLAHHPTVAAVAPRVRSSLPAAQATLIQRYEAARPSLDRGSARAAVRPRSRVPFVPTALLGVRRKSLESVGGFVDGLTRGEDVDLAWRLDASSQSVRYEPTTVVHHPPRPTMRRWIEQRFSYGRSNAELATMHPDHVVAIETSPWSIAAWFLICSGGRARPALGVASVLVSVGGLAALLWPIVADPAKESARLAGVGTLVAGNELAMTSRRSWLPGVIVGAVVSQRARRFAALVAVLPPLLEWFDERPEMNLVEWFFIRGADDAAYAAGQWRGMFDTRSLRAVLIRFQRLSELIVSPS